MFYEGVVRQLSRKFAYRGDDQTTLGAPWSSDSNMLVTGALVHAIPSEEKWKGREALGCLGVRQKRPRS